MARERGNRIRPLEALRGIRALMQDPDDTVRVFDVVSALSGRSGLRLYQRFRQTEAGQRILVERRDLLATLSDRQRLLALPPDSLGRSYGEFMKREDLTAEGLALASAEGGRGDLEDLPEERKLVGARLRDQHDLWHVVTGYGRDLAGEVALLSFTFAQTRNPGIGFIVAFAYRRARGDLRYARRLIRAAWRRGRRAAWLPAQDWEALLERPLADVRRALQVGDPPVYTETRSAGTPAAAPL